jgi:hypothetical protein
MSSFRGKVGDRFYRHIQIDTGEGLKPELTAYVPQIDFEELPSCKTFRVKDKDGLKVVTNKRGLICFCYKDIPDNWTHFVVVKTRSEGRACVVEPVVGDAWDLLEMKLSEVNA